MNNNSFLRHFVPHRNSSLIGLVVLVVFIPLQIYFDIYQNLSLSVAQVIAGLLFIYTIIGQRNRLLNSLLNSSLDYAVVFLLAVMFASIFVSTDKLVSVKYFVKWSSFVLIYFMPEINRPVSG